MKYAVLIAILFSYWIFAQDVLTYVPSEDRYLSRAEIEDDFNELNCRFRLLNRAYANHLRLETDMDLLKTRLPMIDNSDSSFSECRQLSTDKRKECVSLNFQDHVLSENSMYGSMVRLMVESYIEESAEHFGFDSNFSCKKNTSYLTVIDRWVHPTDTIWFNQNVKPYIEEAISFWDLSEQDNRRELANSR